MNTKPLLYLSCLLAATLTTSTMNAGQHRHRGSDKHAVSRPARVNGGARTFARGSRISSWNGQRFNGQRFAANRNWNGQHRSGQRWNSNHWSNNHSNWNWHHHHHHHGRSVVFVDFGFPFWGWGYPYYYDYYPYSYYGGGYYGSGYGSYNFNYGNGYGYDSRYGNGYNNGYDVKVAELQRRLANAGYYQGEIDGIMGSRTHYALKAYRHDHPNAERDYSSGQSPTLRNTPYSPPPVTTEPSQSDE